MFGKLRIALALAAVATGVLTASAEARTVTLAPARVTQFQWLAGNTAWAQPSLSRLARSRWVLDDAGNAVMYQPDGYPALRGRFGRQGSRLVLRGSFSYVTGYSGTSTTEYVAAIDASQRTPTMRIAYSAGQTLAAVLNCNPMSCSRFGSSRSKAFSASLTLRGA
jgi:hypothetical protein